MTLLLRSTPPPNWAYISVSNVTHFEQNFSFVETLQVFGLIIITIPVTELVVPFFVILVVCTWILLFKANRAVGANPPIFGARNYWLIRELEFLTTSQGSMPLDPPYTYWCRKKSMHEQIMFFHFLSVFCWCCYYNVCHVFLTMFSVLFVSLLSVWCAPRQNTTVYSFHKTQSMADE